MKITIILIALFFQTSYAICQVSGKINYLMVLEVNKFNREETQLIFDGHQAVFTLLDMNKKTVVRDGEFSLSAGDGDEFSLGFQIGKESYIPFIYFNLLTKQILSRDYGIFKGETSCFITYEEPNTIDWKLGDESKKIGRFNCQKATATFRGRNYTVWYTQEIPVPLGPWKFNGLPGLILEATDMDGGVQFYFSSAEIPYKGSVRPIPPDDGKMISIEEFAKIFYDSQIEITRIIESKLPRGATFTMNQFIPIGIEKDYEF